MLQEIKTDREYTTKEPAHVADLINSLLNMQDEIDQDKEHLYVIGTGINKKVKYIDLVSLGVRNQTLASMPEIFRRAVHKGVSFIILAHNHPSGTPEPSDEDNLLTMKAVEAGKILEIKVLDHVIVTKKSFFSFRQSFGSTIDW